MISAHNRSKFLFLAFLVVALHPQPVRAVSFNSIGTGICLVGGSYLFALTYSEWVYERALKHYATIRPLVARLETEKAESAYVDTPAYYRRLKHEVLRAHDKFCKSHLFTNPAFKNYPLLWYKDELDSHIQHISNACLFTTGLNRKKDMVALLNELNALKHLLVQDYEFIKERRHYEEAKDLARRVA